MQLAPSAPARMAGQVCSTSGRQALLPALRGPRSSRQHSSRPCVRVHAAGEFAASGRARAGWGERDGRDEDASGPAHCHCSPHTPAPPSTPVLGPPRRASPEGAAGGEAGIQEPGGHAQVLRAVRKAVGGACACARALAHRTMQAAAATVTVAPGAAAQAAWTGAREISMRGRFARPARARAHAHTLPAPSRCQPHPLQSLLALGGFPYNSHALSSHPPPPPRLALAGPGPSSAPTSPSRPWSSRGWRSTRTRWARRCAPAGTTTTSPLRPARGTGTAPACRCASARCAGWVGLPVCKCLCVCARAPVCAYVCARARLCAARDVALQVPRVCLCVHIIALAPPRLCKVLRTVSQWRCPCSYPLFGLPLFEMLGSRAKKARLLLAHETALARTLSIGLTSSSKWWSSCGLLMWFNAFGLAHSRTCHTPNSLNHVSTSWEEEVKLRQWECGSKGVWECGSKGVWECGVHIYNVSVACCVLCCVLPLNQLPHVWATFAAAFTGLGMGELLSWDHGLAISIRSSAGRTMPGRTLLRFTLWAERGALCLLCPRPTRALKGAEGRPSSFPLPPNAAMPTSPSIRPHQTPPWPCRSATACCSWRRTTPSWARSRASA